MKRITEELRCIIEKLAPKWHKHYRITYHSGDWAFVDFCGRAISFPLQNASASLVNNWLDEWTEFEQINWLAVLDRDCSSGRINDDHPLINQHFGILDQLMIKIGLIEIHIYSDWRLVCEIEAYLSHLAQMRAAMAVLPVTIMRAVLYYI
jgi:hypothetical protein